jgi:hypothetical protein
MKKVVTLLIAVLCTFLVANAQVPKGSILFGGSAGFGSSSSSFSGSGGNNSSSNFSLAPRISYAVAPNILLSMRTGINMSQTKYDNGQKTNNRAFDLGIFGKKLFPFKNGFGWYPEVGIWGNLGKYESRTANGTIYTTKGSEFLTGITPGLFYQPSAKVLINVEFGGIRYNYSRIENEFNNSVTKNNGINLNLFQSFQLGFDIIIK